MQNKALLEVRRNIDAGNLETAEEACRHILRANPRSSEAWNLLGWIQGQQGNFSEATNSIGEAIAIDPDQAQLHRNLGSVYWTAADPGMAIECYKRAVDLEPQDVDAQNSLGIALKQHGQLDLAVKHLREALRLCPDIATPYQNLAETLSELGNVDEALQLYEEAVQIAPTDAGLRNGLGVMLKIDGQYEQAIVRFQEALDLKPNHPLYENNLAAALQAAGKVEEALAQYENILRALPNSADTLVNMGNVYLAQGDVQQAATHFGRAVDLQPDHAVAHNNLGSTLADLGDFDAAVTHLEKALQFDPDYVPAYFNLSDLAIQDRYRFSAEMIDKMEQILVHHGESHKDTSALFFAIGNHQDKSGEYDEAFRSFQTANRIQQQIVVEAGNALDMELRREKTDEILSFFDADFFESLPQGGLDSELPIFVIGMPRSGSTLIEQIIVSHPSAVTAGELEEIGLLAKGMPSRLGGDDAFPFCMKHANAETLNELASQYLGDLTKHGKDAIRIVDKMWHNFFYLGFLFVLFPNARVIHCRRDPMDIGMSCYFRRLHSVQWAWSLESIGAYCREYERLMDHWRKVLPSRMYEVQYEQLVTDPEAISQELIDFCGLPWDNRCLEFYKNRGAVKTASRIQVRQPVYTTSIGRWKNYKTHLEPLKKALAGERDTPKN